MADKLGEEHTLVRYVKSSQVMTDENDEVVGVFPAAYEMRVEEVFLSVSWLEYFDQKNGDPQTQLENAFSLKLSKNAVLATHQLQKFSAYCEKFGSKVRILHEPEVSGNLSHVAVRQYPRENVKLFAVLAHVSKVIRLKSK